MSPESQYLLKLLADMQWHPLPQILDKLTAGVAPGKALRRYASTAAAREKVKGPRVGAQLSEDEQIACGRRTIANATVHSMRKRYVVVVETVDGPLVRRREQPLPIADYRAPGPAAHPPALPPPALPPPAAAPPPDRTVPADVAFFSESQVRQIVAEVVGQALDDFQRGLHGFLSARFAEVDRALLSRRDRSHLPRRLR